MIIPLRAAILRYRDFNNFSGLLSSKPRQTRYQKKGGSRLSHALSEARVGSADRPLRGDIPPPQYVLFCPGKNVKLSNSGDKERQWRHTV